MTKQGPNDPYTKARGAMRTVGPILLVVGALMVLIGGGQFIMMMVQTMSGGDLKPPILFIVLGLPGMILLGVGMQLTGIGFIGAFTQYFAKESTPAAQTTVTAIRSAIFDDDVPCPTCSLPVEPDSAFCSHCGVQIGGLACGACQAEIQADDRFCGSCGTSVEARA